MKKKGIFLGLVLLSTFAMASCAKDGHTPEITIGENGNWFVDGEDQGVPAQGEKGDTGISVVSVTKGTSIDNTDTYIVNYSDGTTSTFTVKNGNDGKDADDLTVKNISIKSSTNNVDTYEIEFSDGYKTTFTVTNGEDGKNLSVISINKESTDGLYDTYKISFSDESYQTFIVKNGKDGLTPYIGDNGNWWIGDEDTGVLADYEKANNVPLTIYSSGLKYETRTINGVNGYVVTGWEMLDDEYLYSVYGNDLTQSFSDLSDKTLVIPNYVGNIPVIGVMGNSKLNFGKVILSKNTIYLDVDTFYNCSNLKEIDFNGCEITSIPEDCFNGTSLKSIDIPESVTHIFERAFYKLNLNKIDLKNVKYIGNEAFNSSFIDYIYLTDNIEYVGDNVFDTTFVYVEAETKPANWGSISSSAYSIKYNVKMNDEYLYSIDNNEATIYQYLGNEEKLVVPAKIDNVPITVIGSGFNSDIFDDNQFSSMTDSEMYQYLKNKDGYIKELIIGNNVRKIDQYALLNGNMFIYITSSVEEVYISSTIDEGIIGCYLDQDEDRAPFSLVVVEDTSKTKVNYEGTIETFDELIASDDDYVILFKTNIDYDDIYHADNDIYYYKTNNGYEVLAYKNSYKDEVFVLDSIDNLKVTSIGKLAFVNSYFNKLTIGNNVNKIKSNAFYECKGNVFIPNNVEIINANAFDYDSTMIYVEVSQKPDDWDSNWNSNNTNVMYSISKESFENMVFTNDYIGVIKADNTIELLKYTGSYSYSIKIPRTINGRTVTSIATDCFKTSSSYSNLSFYIPNTVTTIKEKTFDLYQNSYSYAYIYLEASNIPSTFETNWYYNSYYGSTNNITVTTGKKLDY